MLRKILSENYEVDQAQLAQNIFRSLEDIKLKLEDEIANKQTIVEGCTTEIKVLRSQVVLKDHVIQNLETKISDSERSIEGNRQLINKLLNDLDRMQQDIEWYKRTYERRSFLGYLKEYLSGKIHKRI